MDRRTKPNCSAAIDPPRVLIVDHVVLSPSLDQLIVKQKIEALEAISGALGMPLTMDPDPDPEHWLTVYHMVFVSLSRSADCEAED